ncbi:hypothetical protein C8R44DRAFT_981813 [Mycena epipterygia]|nr:hypothetical protein C8R44DRAFT_981813 [Mycena epipterygia]
MPPFQSRNVDRKIFPTSGSHAQLLPHGQLIATAPPRRAFKLPEGWAALKEPLHADWASPSRGIGARVQPLLATLTERP